jgi:hypothetical protein
MDSKERLSQFKNRGTLKQDELRRRREDVAVEIRKQKREESLAKRRNLQLVSSTVSDEEDEGQQMTMTVQVIFFIFWKVIV